MLETPLLLFCMQVPLRGEFQEDFLSFSLRLGRVSHLFRLIISNGRIITITVRVTKNSVQQTAGINAGNAIMRAFAPNRMTRILQSKRNHFTAIVPGKPLRRGV